MPLVDRYMVLRPELGGERRDVPTMRRTPDSHRVNAAAALRIAAVCE